ncbi:MAG: DinB family protein [Kibdelosporangium sp.]
MTIDRVDAPFAGDERAQLTGHLDWVRDTVRLKVDGLSQEDARRALLPSRLTTVAGLLSHLRWVEAYWFRTILSGQAGAAPYSAEDPDAEFRTGLTTDLEVLVDEYEQECRNSRDVTATLALDYAVPFRNKGPLNVRWVLVHMTQETARHAGHLDILRELLDGRTGE